MIFFADMLSGNRNCRPSIKSMKHICSQKITAGGYAWTADGSPDQQPKHPEVKNMFIFCTGIYLSSGNIKRIVVSGKGNVNYVLMYKVVVVMFL